MISSFWYGLILGGGLVYIISRADFYIQLSRGNIMLNRPLNKAEILITGSVSVAREKRERKKNV